MAYGKKDSLDDYITVNERVVQFYKKYPGGSIQTEIIDLVPSADPNKPGYEAVLIKAMAFRWPDDPQPSVGHAHEWRDDPKSFVNKTSMIENGETSAVGRALANMGIEVSKAIASREEVERAKAREKQLKDMDKTAVQISEEETQDDDAKARVAVIAKVGDLHKQLQATSLDQKLELLNESKIASNFNNLTTEQLEKYVNFLYTKLGQ